MSQHRRFTPETAIFHPEKLSLSYFTDCGKKENHDRYLSPLNITLQDLPPKWKKDEILITLKNIAQRVVHLTVLKRSSSRPVNTNLQESQQDNERSVGSGFLTFHPVHGAVVHTSKHVVYDDYEARWTIVRLFYNDEDDENIHTQMAVNDFISSVLSNESVQSISPSTETEEEAGDNSGLFLSRGNCNFFRSVMCCDYTAFSCDIPFHELFSAEEISQLEGAFSWWNFSLKKFVLQPNADIDIAIISHPHGVAKKIAFGKMNRLVGVSPSLYDAPTCSGSSGSPIIRLHLLGKRLISVGQFVHHGHNKSILDMGMGMIRPPFAFPYRKSLDTEEALANGVSILYEPINYWAMFGADLLHVESTFINSLDVFAYTSSWTALLLTVNSTLFKVLFSGFWIHIFCGFLLNWKRSGLSYALANTILHFISMMMFIVCWAMLFWAPWPLTNMFVLIAVWSIVLYFERYYYLSARFVNYTFGSFPELVNFMLQTELGIKMKNSQHSCDLVTTQHTES